MVNKILNSNGFKRILIFLFVSLVLFALRDMINLILFTFIFGFLMDRLVQFIHERGSLNRKLIVVLSYVIIVGLLSLGLVKYMPVVIREITELIKELTAFYTAKHNNFILNYVFNRMEQIQISNYLEQSFTYIIKYFTDISRVGLQVLLALLLSLFFQLEKPRLIAFTKKFKTSKVAF